MNADNSDDRIRFGSVILTRRGEFTLVGTGVLILLALLAVIGAVEL